VGVNVHDLLDSISGLRGYAKDLRHTVSQSPFSYEENRSLVPMDATDLETLAEFLEGVADEIQNLIPNQAISLKQKNPADQ